MFHTSLNKNTVIKVPGNDFSLSILLLSVQHDVDNISLSLTIHCPVLDLKAHYYPVFENFLKSSNQYLLYPNHYLILLHMISHWMSI